MPFPVNAELVAVTWLRTLGLTAAVATTVPEHGDAFAANGFVQVVAAPGGSPDLYTGRQATVVQVDSWAYSAGSRKPPYGLAATLLATVKAEVDGVDLNQTLTTSATFLDVRLLGGYVQRDPIRVPDDGGLAHYSMDLLLWWVPIAEAAA